MADLLSISGMLASSDDGLASWRRFMDGFEAHVSGQQALVPMVAGVGALIALMGFNLWLARRLMGDRTRPGTKRR